MDVKREGESYSQCCTLELLEGSVFVAAFFAKEEIIEGYAAIMSSSHYLFRRSWAQF